MPEEDLDLVKTLAFAIYRAFYRRFNGKIDENDLVPNGDEYEPAARYILKALRDAAYKIEE